MAVRAVAFDLDGTLYPFRHLALRAAAFAVRNVRHSRSFWRVREEIRRIRPIGSFRQRQAELFAASSGMGIEEARSWIDRKIYQEWVRSFHSIEPCPGLREALDQIERRGCALAVLSDFPVVEKLGYLGLSGRFAVAMCSEESEYLKPNPEPFALLARRLGLPPAEILFVGDSYDYDIVGAHGAGFVAAHILRRPRSDSVADIQFSAYRQLPERLARF
jgi:putative hydrolase of the HAD superfamily